MVMSSFSRLNAQGSCDFMWPLQ